MLNSKTWDLIWPTIRNTYGATDTTRAMATELVRRIDGDEWDSRGREYGIHMILWNWFAGGGTAEQAARQIERALQQHPADVGRDQENLHDFS